MLKNKEITSTVLETLKDVTGEQFTFDDLLINRIDSLQALEILVQVEQELNIEILDDDLFEKGAWDSVKNLVEYFENTLAAIN
jgi:acyl carrier protein